MLANLARRFPLWCAAALIAGLACALYGPFLNNPRVFDDWVFFSGEFFEYYATHPFGLMMRLPAYFTMALTEIEIGTMLAHRLVSLALHVAVALALCKLIYELLRAVLPPEQGEKAIRSSAALWACAGGVLFVIHPVGVYGAAYLVQRTIVLATLFSLLSIWLFVRGLTRRRHADALSAALMYSVAVLSKEHAVLLPGVTVLASFLIGDRRFAFRHAAIHLIACIPAAVFVVLARKGLIGHGYEPDFAGLATQLEGVFTQAVESFSWGLSAVTQAGLFFKYIAAWLWPDTGGMSIDVRVDFLSTWSAGWIVLKIGAFLAYAVVGFVLLLRGGRAGLVGFGMLYAWVLFLVELSTVRFQEPYVLYRSYLWAPGFLIAAAAILSALPVRAATAATVLAVPVLLYQAHDRLVTFSDSLLLWEDAYRKLPQQPVPWGSRTLYMVGREYVYGGKRDKAIEVADRCLTQYPNTVHCYFARGFIHYLSGEYALALPYISRAVELRPGGAIAHHRLGLVLEHLGRIPEAMAEYRRASELGFTGADYEIERLESAKGRTARGKRDSVR
jgi:tetratricopeptide (TPR) repeat protein